MQMRTFVRQYQLARKYIHLDFEGGGLWVPPLGTPMMYSIISNKATVKDFTRSLDLIGLC